MPAALVPGLTPSGMKIAGVADTTCGPARNGPLTVVYRSGFDLVCQLGFSIAVAVFAHS